MLSDLADEHLWRSSEYGGTLHNNYQEQIGFALTKGLTLKTSAFNLFTVANLPYQLSW